MSYEQLKQQLDDYNWDNGFEIPSQIISNPGCDLSLALEVFYLTDGYSFLMKISNEEKRNNEWYTFIENLYQDINDGKYLKSNHRFKIPLTKVQCFKLRKNNISNLFLEDI